MEESGTVDGMDHDGMGCAEVSIRSGEQETIEQGNVLLANLPNDLAILCLARVPRSYHRNMRAVSQSWRKLLHGKTFSKARQELSLLEEWLYVWTETGHVRGACKEKWYCFDPSLRQWGALPTVPRADDREIRHSAYASFDGKLFVIGGSFLKFDKFSAATHASCKTVLYFDARSCSWKKAADLKIARASCTAGIIGDQLYVFGGYADGCQDVTNTAEIYDSITDTWKLIPNAKFPLAMHDSAVIGEKLYAVNSTGRLKAIVYNAQTDEWEKMAPRMSTGWGSKSVVHDGRLYTVGSEYVAGKDAWGGFGPEYEQTIRVYNPKGDVWEIVEEDWGDDNGSRCMWMKDVEVVSIGGKLCIVSTENFGTISGGVVSTVCMVAFEVKDFGKNVVCSMTSMDEFDVPYIDDTPCMSEVSKRCQVVAL